MTKLFTYALWVIQVACLIVILVEAWQLLDRQIFGLVAASLTLVVTLYLENTLPIEGEP